MARSSSPIYKNNPSSAFETAKPTNWAFSEPDGADVVVELVELGDVLGDAAWLLPAPKINGPLVAATLGDAFNASGA